MSGDVACFIGFYNDAIPDNEDPWVAFAQNYINV